jgi:NAD(P)H dehydrogenase (quinone)
MNTLIVLAHPESRSFNAALAHTAHASLEAQGHAVRLHDLQASGFAADEHARHYARRKNPSRFDAQTEQRYSADANALPHDVQAEIDDLLWADLVVLQFPLWWFGMPAILKGWMDRVFAYGKLYSSRRRLWTGVCRGKRALLSVTAGSSAADCSPDGKEGDTRLILWPIHYSLHYVGFTVLEPAIVTGVRGGLDGEQALAQAHYLERELGEHRARLANIDARAALRFNAAQDWDEHGKLRPGAPVHSPFIRHVRDTA